MALQQDVQDERFGNVIKDSYQKLAYFRWSDADSKVMATMSVFATPTARGEGKECITNIEVDVTDLFPDLQKKLYDRIKTDPRFVDAVDV